MLSYDFIHDMYHYDDADLQRRLPTLILHGRQDEVIPVQTSREFSATRPWIQLIEVVESDHSLASVQVQLWQIIQEFCQMASKQR